MKIRFLGAAGEVTGSGFLLTSAGARVLVDLGMFQGEGAGEKNKRPLNLGGLSAVVLSHAHLDHSGRLPLLLKEGYRGRIYANKPTIDLAYLVLKDSAKIAEGNLESKGTVPLYDEDDVDNLMELFEVVDYGTWKEIGEGVKLRLLDAGHILGSSSVEIVADGKTIVFSGDLGNSPSTIVKELEEPKAAEVVVMESTYGDRDHPPRGEETEIIKRLCQEIQKSGGTLLMPAFSLERTQELLLIFDYLKRNKAVAEDLIVYLDSPMGLKATGIYERYPELFNSELQAQKKWDDPFDFPGLVLVEKGQESKKIDKEGGAKVIIAGSGMMAGGRITFHARRWLPEKKTIVLFSGYQAMGTLGRKVLEGNREVAIDGMMVEVNARIEEVTSMSAHADQKQLLKWLSEIKGVKKVVLAHGEDPARVVFKLEVEKQHPGIEVIVPKYEDEIEV